VIATSLPHLDQIIGVHPEQEEEVICKGTKAYEMGGEWKSCELEKTQRDLAILSLVLKSIGEYLAYYDRPKDIPAPLSHIHILKPGGTELLTRGKLAVGSHSTILGEIIADRRSDVEFAITLFHELWHLKTYNALQVTRQKDIREWKNGVCIYRRDGAACHLRCMNEGLTGLMTRRFFDEIMVGHPLFKGLIGHPGEVDTTRHEELNLIWKIIRAVYERNTHNYLCKEAVADEFIRAQMTGNLSVCGRLINTLASRLFRKLFLSDVRPT
jgi:hypothetical protein